MNNAEPTLRLRLSSRLRLMALNLIEDLIDDLEYPAWVAVDAKILSDWKEFILA
jgi:hypothetical protein